MNNLSKTFSFNRSREGFRDWTFSTVRYWGEEPFGLWKLIIQDKGKDYDEPGTLVSWRITFYGSLLTSQQINERKR